MNAHWHQTKEIWVDRVLYLLRGLQLWPWPWIFKLKFKKELCHRNGTADWHGKMEFEAIGYGTHVVSLNYDLTNDLDLGFSRWNIKVSVLMKGMWVGYDVGCTMELTLGHSACQMDQPSYGSMWNSYSFQPVGPWMGYLFTDLGAEGCCRSLNALLIFLRPFIKI